MTAKIKGIKKLTSLGKKEVILILKNYLNKNQKFQTQKTTHPM